MQLGFDDIKKIIELLGYQITKNTNELKNFIYLDLDGWFIF